jgi:hypothetical protein
MAELPAATLQRIETLRPMVAALLAERGIGDASKVCNFLAVTLRLRPMALTYLPAELPGGIRMGEAIDRYFAERYRPPAGGRGGRFRGLFGRGRRGASPKEEELIAKRKVLEAAYNEVAASSPAYAAHLAWLDRLGLDQIQIKRRPTLREMFIYHDRATRRRLVELEEAAAAGRSRPTTGAEGDAEQAMIEYVYATEFDRDYLRGVAALLGYPECCVEKYAEDRLKGQNVEQRGYEQIKAMQEAGKPIDVHVYYVKDFFPCSPDCAVAIARGEQFEAAFAALGDEVRDVYVGSLYDSFQLAQSYPLLIQQHKERLNKAIRRQ